MRFEIISVRTFAETIRRRIGDYAPKGAIRKANNVLQGTAHKFAVP